MTTTLKEVINTLIEILDIDEYANEDEKENALDSALNYLDDTIFLDSDTYFEVNRLIENSEDGYEACGRLARYLEEKESK